MDSVPKRTKSETDRQTDVQTNQNDMSVGEDIG